MDCFAPQEASIAPSAYCRPYADGSHEDPIGSRCRCDRDLAALTEDQVRGIVSHHSGLLARVNERFGRMLRKLDDVCLTDRAKAMFASDHSTNSGENLWRIMGKPAR